MDARFGDRRAPAARLGALRRARLDAGHDGHGAEPRPQRRDRRGARASRRRALRLRLATGASSRCTATSCSACRTSASRHRLETLKASRSARPRHRSSTPTPGASWSREYLRIVEEETGKPFPQDPARAALGRDRRGLPLLERRTRAITYRKLNGIPDELGHRRQRAGDGVRQHGRRLRHRRRLHARPVDRREHLLRRVPDERAGRGRRRRHPHAAADQQGEPQRRPGASADPRRGDCRRRTSSCSASARRSRSTTATCRTSSSRSSTASSGCCRRAPASARPAPRCGSPSTWRASG